MPIEAQPLAPSEMGTTQISETSIMRSIAEAEQNSDFFAAQQQDFQDWTQNAKKKHRHRGLKIFLVILILLALVGGAGTYAYVQGIGFPSQQDQITALFNDPSNNEVYASDLDDNAKSRIADMVVTSSTITVNGTTNSFSTADAYVTATTQQGGEIPYQISLVRDGLGWKISNVSLSFASQSAQ